jgi:hypothetical protein
MNVRRISGLYGQCEESTRREHRTNAVVGNDAALRACCSPLTVSSTAFDPSVSVGSASAQSALPEAVTAPVVKLYENRFA